LQGLGGPCDLRIRVELLDGAHGLLVDVGCATNNRSSRCNSNILTFL
jgi:hypothetical protein